MLPPADHQRLARNLAHVRERIAAACQAAGRDPAEVGLVTVTKYAGPALAGSLLALGQRDLGENRVGHLLELDAALRGSQPGPRWHMVGHLQKNKARKVVDLLACLHSLDDLALAEQLSRRRDPGLPPLEVYLEVRLDPTQGRSGVEPDQLEELAAGVRRLTGLRLVGLMGLPPIGEPEDARPHFRRLGALRERLSEDELALSMGMTSDLEVAISEGSTCVRVGRALLEGIDPEALAR